MTDLEIHQALIAAVKAATNVSDGDRVAALAELDRHKVGCKAAPWRDCPVIGHYAGVYKIDLAAVGAAKVAGPRTEHGSSRVSA